MSFGKDGAIAVMVARSALMVAHLCTACSLLRRLCSRLRTGGSYLCQEACQGLQLEIVEEDMMSLQLPYIPGCGRSCACAVWDFGTVRPRSGRTLVESVRRASCIGGLSHSLT
jgi:hypothetical protein